MFKSKNKKIISVIVLVFLILAGVFFVYKNTQVKNINLNKNTPPPNLPLSKGEELGGGQSQAILATLEINGVSYEGKITKKTSVYDFMSELRNEGKINFVEKNYIGMGEMITEINGIKNNSSQSWIYYVNGKEASVGVSNYKIKSGDTVSWKYEKSNY